MNFGTVLSSQAPSYTNMLKVEVRKANFGKSKKKGTPGIFLGCKVIEVLTGDDDEREIDEGTSVSSFLATEYPGLVLPFLEAAGFSLADLEEDGFNEENVEAPDADEYLIGRIAYCLYTPADPENNKQYGEPEWLPEHIALAKAEAMNAGGGGGEVEAGIG